MTVFQRIDGPNCGCDAHIHKKNFISVDEALKCIAQNTVPIDSVDLVSLANASGRVLKRSVRSQGMVPPFDNSAMDGYAVRSNDLQGGGPWKLQIVDRVAAGQSGTVRISPGTAAQIFTGAPLPTGADAIVMQEDVERAENMIVLHRKVIAGDHVRLVGEDMISDTTIVPAGRRLTARDIAACAAAGQADLQVCRPIRVALVVTGDEVHQTGTARGTAGIWDVNSPMLSAAMSEHSIELTCVLRACDTRAGLKDQLAALGEKADIIVTTGGISVGEEDHVKPVINELGGKIVFSGVALKPGKPVSFGQLGRASWLGLPGNPLAAFLTWCLFGSAVCRALTGSQEHRAQRRHVVLAHELHHTLGRCEVRLANLVGFDSAGREVAEFASATHSGRVARLPGMDGMLFIPADVETLRSGALVEFQPF